MNDPQIPQIIGAAMKVHRELGCGFLENVNQYALAVELEMQGVPFEKEVELAVYYSDVKPGCTYRGDVVCFNNVLVEWKALAKFSATEESQVLNYLKASNLEKALLINFGTKSLEFKRFVN